MGLDKVSLQAIGGFGGSWGKPRVAKVVDPSVEWARQVRAAIGRQALLIVRWVQASQPLDNPKARAQQFVARYQSQMVAMAQGDPNIAFEGLNEIADSNAPAYCEFEVERLRLMHGLGLRSVVGNFSVGTPDLPTWATYRPLLAALGPGDSVGLHEYWTDRQDIENRWHAGRWSLVPALANVPIAVTEVGRDRVEARGKPGWQQSCSAEEFLADLRRYGWLLDQFPNVVGATVYQTGSVDPKWRPFEVRHMWPSVVREYSVPQTYPWVALPVVVPPPTPPTPPPPKPPARLVIDGRCMTTPEFEQHLRTVNLTGVTDIMVHHTLVPTEASWQGDRTIEAMRKNYERKGWEKGPHLFCGPEGIWLFWTLGQDGYGVTARNKGVRHVEIVGDYSDHAPSGAILKHAVAAAGALVKALDLPINRVHMHREWERTSCPGEAFAREWESFTTAVWHAAGEDLALPSHLLLPGDNAELARVCRWWTEQSIRERQEGRRDYADDILLDLVNVDRGFLYELERRLDI